MDRVFCSLLYCTTSSTSECTVVQYCICVDLPYIPGTVYCAVQYGLQCAILRVPTLQYSTVRFTTNGFSDCIYNLYSTVRIQYNHPRIHDSGMKSCPCAGKIEYYSTEYCTVRYGFMCMCMCMCIAWELRLLLSNLVGAKGVIIFFYILSTVRQYCTE